MFSDRTLALLVPFLVATSQATVIDVPGDGAVDTQSSAQSPIQILTGGYDCQPNNDWDCYKRYYQEYNYCHPQDVWCYKDCRDWDQYKDHCYHKDFDFKCYDKCHYDHDGCGKWNECRENDYDCYKRKHEDHFPRGKDPYYKQPDGGNYCKPWDWNCHKREHHDHGDYVCNPWKDKHCYPYYYPEPHVPEKIPPRQPNNDVWVYFYSPCEGPCHEHGYTRKIWPDGDEVFTEMGHVPVDHITYVTDKGDEDVRCLPMLNFFPWTPLPLERYVEKFDVRDGKKMRVLHFKEPQPVEVIRCDFY